MIDVSSTVNTFIVLTVTPSNKENTVSEDNGAFEICLTKDKETARGFNVAMVFTEDTNTSNTATGKFVYCTYTTTHCAQYCHPGWTQS